MGAGSSRETPDQSQHVFAADGPVRFSQSVIDSLQNSPETDSTRSRTLELQIQSRVTAELEKIRDQEAQRLTALTSHLTPTDEPSTDASSSSSSSSSNDGSSSVADKISAALTPSSSSAADDEKRRSHDSVKKEIESLRSKLDKRRKLEAVDPGVEKAKEDLVGCLRTNDRRPLDCYAEVEAFKNEVGRLERAFVERTMR